MLPPVINGSRAIWHPPLGHSNSTPQELTIGCGRAGPPSPDELAAGSPHRSSYLGLASFQLEPQLPVPMYITISFYN